MLVKNNSFTEDANPPTAATWPIFHTMDMFVLWTLCSLRSMSGMLWSDMFVYTAAVLRACGLYTVCDCVWSVCIIKPMVDWFTLDRSISRRSVMHGWSCWDEMGLRLLTMRATAAAAAAAAAVALQLVSVWRVEHLSEGRDVTILLNWEKLINHGYVRCF